MNVGKKDNTPKQHRHYRGRAQTQKGAHIPKKKHARAQRTHTSTAYMEDVKQQTMDIDQQFF